MPLRPARTGWTSTINVLIIADEPLTRQVLSEVIAAEGGQPVAVGGIKQGLMELERSQYPLIYAPAELDTGTPAELCGVLRATRGGTGATIIALPRAALVVPRSLAQAGFDGLLRAPFDPTEIAFQVQCAARRMHALEDCWTDRSRAAELTRLPIELARGQIPEQQARQILAVALKLLPATRGAVWLREQEQQGMRCAASMHLSTSYPQRAGALLSSTSQDQWQELARRPELQTNLRDQPGPLGDLARAEAIDAAFTLALATPAGIHGLMVLYLEGHGIPNSAEIALAEAIAATGALAFDSGGHPPPTRRGLGIMRQVAEILAAEQQLEDSVRAVLHALRDDGGYTWLSVWTFGRAAGTTLLIEESTLDPSLAAAVRARALDQYRAGAELRLLPPQAGQPPLLATPLTNADRHLGLLVAAQPDGETFDEDHAALLAAVAAQLGSALERSRLRRELDSRALIDPTTGLDNRAAFLRHLEHALARSAAQPVSLLMLGVDHFKQLNDVYGHAIGDQLLQQVGQLIAAQLTSGQHVARFTSDEFAVLLPGVARTEVFAIGERIRISIGTKLFTAAEQVEQLTVSLGVATFPDDATNSDRLVTAASHALYLAKQAGRNQVYQTNEAFAELAPAHGRIADLLRQAPKETLALIVRAMDQRLPERAGHAQRVAQVAVELGRALGLEHARVAALRVAALAHDIGMFALPDALLRKPSRLSPEERELLAGTPLVAHRLLSQIELPPTVLPAVVHQHEHWDGSGYPARLAGPAIPLEARIIAVSDAFDALTSARAHRAPLTTEAALEVLRQSAGQQFDPAVVEAAVRLRGRLPEPDAFPSAEIAASLDHALELIEA